jgi:hypothetical protein
MSNAKRVEQAKAKAAKRKAKAAEKRQAEEAKSPWSKDEDRAILLAQMKTNSSTQSTDLANELNDKGEAAIKRRWNRVLIPKVEKYLSLKNLGGNHRLCDEFGSYLLKEEDLDGFLEKSREEFTEQNGGDSGDEAASRLSKHGPDTVVARQSPLKNSSPSQAKKRPAPTRQDLPPNRDQPPQLPQHPATAPVNLHPVHLNKRPRASPPSNTPDLTTVLNEIKIFQRSVMAMRSMTNELLASQTELRHEVQLLRRSGIRNNESLIGPHEMEMRRRYGRADGGSSRGENTAAAAAASVATRKNANSDAANSQNQTEDTTTTNDPDDTEMQPASNNTVDPTTDEEMNAYIVSLKLANKWPLIMNPSKAFTRDPSLVKLRFHNSNQHQHLPVKIDRKERSHCRLCHVRGIKNSKRRTLYMCSTCEIPLCIKPLKSDVERGILDTHFNKWHSVVDLEAERVRCSGDLLREIEIHKQMMNAKKAAAAAVEQEGTGEKLEEDGEEDDEESAGSI